MFSSNRLKPPDHESYNNLFCTITPDGQRNQNNAYMSFYSEVCRGNVKECLLLYQKCYVSQFDGPRPLS